MFLIRNLPTVDDNIFKTIIKWYADWPLSDFTITSKKFALINYAISFVISMSYFQHLAIIIIIIIIIIMIIIIIIL